MPVKPATGSEFAVPLMHRSRRLRLRGCLGFLEDQVRYGERHIALDACWWAITFKNFRAVVVHSMAAKHWPSIGLRNPPMQQHLGSTV